MYGGNTSIGINMQPSLPSILASYKMSSQDLNRGPLRWVVGSTQRVRDGGFEPAIVRIKVL